ncbi:hypothetical protein PVK06_033822 [Gossypium arboreum]|uniref:Secreted protein n=1 Tax=Gossypium arboreum TaxID=29729 RepID=A0ABR0ND11_GOSAR|nr:hypothetical protein PVK06_033822 [Gossypium arboreum]
MVVITLVATNLVFSLGAKRRTRASITIEIEATYAAKKKAGKGEELVFAVATNHKRTGWKRSSSSRTEIMKILKTFGKI